MHDQAAGINGTKRPKRPIVVAGCSGGTVDRDRGILSLSQVPEIDVITGDWMSEADMTVNGAKRELLKAQIGDMHDLGRVRDGYHANFLQKIEPALVNLQANGTKVVCNAGGSNAHGLAEEVKRLIAQQQLHLTVSWIEGDDVSTAVLGLIQSGAPLSSLQTGKSIQDWPFTPICAQCYLGAFGIARALEESDIVICGRVADSSPCVGAAMWWHGWTRDHLQELASALVAGHLIECSTYVTGGCYAGFRKWKGTAIDLGFPIAHIAHTGEFEIGMESSRDGEVSIGTVTSQLVYEIQGPLYYNSSVVARLDGLQLRETGHNRVRVTGVRGLPPPPTTKAGITAAGGFCAEYHIFLSGLDIEEKAEMVKAQTIAAMGPENHRKLSLLTFTVVGVPQSNPHSQDAATVNLRVVAQSPDAELLAPHNFLRWCKSSILQGCPGLTPTVDSRQGVGRPYFEYWATTIDQTLVEERVHLPDGRTVDIAPPSRTQEYPRQQQSHEAFNPLPLDSWGATMPAPLGYVCLGRSGDKSSDANIGLFVRHDDEWDWLRSTLTTKRFQRLLGRDYVGKPIDRFEIPGLKAVHFLLRDHLDRGYNACAGLDCLGKNLVEYIRSKYVDIPTRFLERSRP